MISKNDPDYRLVHKAKKGNSPAFGKLVEKYQDRILDLVLGTIQADRAFIMLIDEETGDYGLTSSRKGKAYEGPEELDVSRTIIDQVLETGESLLISDVQEDDRFMDADSVVFHNIRSVMCVPIKAKGRIFGIMYLDNKGTVLGFTEDDLHLIIILDVIKVPNNSNRIQ